MSSGVNIASVTVLQLPLSPVEDFLSFFCPFISFRPPFSHSYPSASLPYTFLRPQIVIPVSTPPFFLIKHIHTSDSLENPIFLNLFIRHSSRNVPTLCFFFSLSLFLQPFSKIAHYQSRQQKQKKLVAGLMGIVNLSQFIVLIQVYLNLIIYPLTAYTSLSVHCTVMGGWGSIEYTLDSHQSSQHKKTYSKTNYIYVYTHNINSI